MLRKIVFMFVLILSLLNLLGCANNLVSTEQSKKNFQTYHDAIQIVLDGYDLDLLEEVDPNVENQKSYRDFCVIINENAKIKIRMINSAYRTNTGAESFSIDYFLYDCDALREFDIRLFVDLINCISGKAMSSDFCHSFLDAPESEYAAEKYGYKKLNGEIIAKMQPMNFSEDWVLSYYKTVEKEHLSFGGLTKGQNG